MKRILAGIAAVAVAGLVAATPATAAQSTVKRETFRGFSVDANWAVSTSSSYDETYVAASQSNQGSTLVLTAVHGNLDAGGNFTGGRVTSAEVGSGFTFTFDAVRLATAHIRATGVPARTCDVDESGTEFNCSETTLDVDVAWVGQGAIGRGVTNEHFKQAGFSVNNHSRGVFRDATATGSLDGVALMAADLQFASLNKGVSLMIMRVGK